ncbi:hypothetical protein EYC80_005747 [Monilinia laxa]|uniref:Uncharacterized protein n=1 Tax=Monilinia laxa TaxID=61186 RepID=A0A5N6KEY1_MONLA|nr:hypothetical protein EYC80_005747 [Monilinia laxa]
MNFRCLDASRQWGLMKYNGIGTIVLEAHTYSGRCYGYGVCILRPSLLLQHHNKQHTMVNDNPSIIIRQKYSIHSTLRLRTHCQYNPQ